MTRLKSVIFLFIFLITVVIGNFVLYDFFTNPGQGFSTENLRSRHIVNYITLFTNGFFPLFFYFRVFSAYMLMMIFILLVVAPIFFIRKNRILIMLFFSLLTTISVYSSLNYRYHMTLFPLVFYFVGKGLDLKLNNLFLKFYSLLLILLIFFSMKNQIPLMKKIYTENIKSELRSKDSSTFDACSFMTRSPDFSVLTVGSDEIESFCNIKYLKFENIYYQARKNHQELINKLIEEGYNLVLVRKGKKEADFCSYITKYRLIFSNDYYLIYSLKELEN